MTMLLTPALLTGAEAVASGDASDRSGRRSRLSDHAPDADDRDLLEDGREREARAELVNVESEHRR